MKINIPANTTEIIYVYGKQIAPIFGEHIADRFKKHANGYSNSEIRQLASFYLTGLIREVDSE